MSLSVFPTSIDSKETLYEATNNSETTLKHALSYSGTNIVVESAVGFPSSGLIRVGKKGPMAPEAELIFYGSRTDTVFSDLIRGYGGSRRNQWPAKETYVSNAVLAEHHNAVKEAIVNIETLLGLTTDGQSATSLNGRLKALETKFLTPKALFRGFPLKGTPPLEVSFQNLSSADTVRSLWDFGDGYTSVDRNPFHTYLQEGIYTVKLNIITSTGAQGISSKTNYITVSNAEVEPFFYAVNLGYDKYRFIDQTDGIVASRYWVFGDGTTTLQVTDPDIHTAAHTYTKAGIYSPTLLVVFGDGTFKRSTLDTPIVIE